MQRSLLLSTSLRAAWLALLLPALFVEIALVSPPNGVAQNRRRSSAPPGARFGQNRGRRFGRFLGQKNLADFRPTTWQVWWELNKELYLGLGRRGARGGRTAGKGGAPFLGRRRLADRAARPFGGDLRIRLVRPDLEIALRDKMTLVRRAAAYALGLLGDRRSSDALINALGDNGSEVQDAALLSLGMLPGPRPLRVLTAVLAGDPRATKLLGHDRINDQRRATAAIALGLTGEAKAWLPLARAATTRRVAREVKAAAIVGLGLLGLPDGEEVLVAILNRKKAQTQMKALAATSLGRVGGVRARAALLRAVRSKRSEVRRAAALALANLPLRTPVQGRLRLVIRSRRDARGAPPETLARLDAYINELEEPAEEERTELEAFEAARRKALRSAAAGDTEYAVRQFAALALGQVGRAEDRQLLLHILDSEILDLRPFAALALGLLGARGGDRDGAAARVLFSEFNKEERLDHRIAFALALAMRGWREAGRRILEELRSSREPLSRSYYAIALGMLRYSEGLKEVVETLRIAREVNEVQLSAMAYGLLADDASANHLVKVVKRNKDRFETMAAGVSLAFLGRSEDLRLLSRYVRNPDNPADTRAFIMEGLGVAGDVRDPGPLLRLASAHDFFLDFDAIDRAILRKW